VAGEKVLVLNQLTTRIIHGVGAFLQPAVGLFCPTTWFYLNLTPISSSEASPSWTSAFTNRLLIFRHHVLADTLKSPETATSVRYISILKAGGVNYENEDGPIISMSIGEVRKYQSPPLLISNLFCESIQNGISDVEYLPDTDPNGTTRTPSPTPQTPAPTIHPSPQSHIGKLSNGPCRPRHPAVPVSPLKSQGKRKREIADSEDEDDGESGGGELYADGVELDLIQEAEEGGEGLGQRRFGVGDGSGTRSTNFVE